MAPAERTGATAMRPSFGTIGRSGVMSLVDSLVSVQTQTSCLTVLQRKLCTCLLHGACSPECRHASHKVHMTAMLTPSGILSNSVRINV